MLPAVASMIVPPGPQPAPALGLLDHGHADAVLDAAAGIERLELDQHPRGHTLAQPMQRDQRRPTDRVEDALARSLSRGVLTLACGHVHSPIFGAMDPRPHTSLRARWVLFRTVQNRSGRNPILSGDP